MALSTGQTVRQAEGAGELIAIACVPKFDKKMNDGVEEEVEERVLQ